MTSAVTKFFVFGIAGLFGLNNCLPSGEVASLNTVQDIQSVLADHGALSNAYLSFTETYDKEHDPARLDVFKSNLQNIVDHNSEADEGKQSFTLGVNKFSDMTAQEVIDKFTGYSPSSANSANSIEASGTPRSPPMIKWSSPPASLDWRTHQVVSPVKDQKNCGSCVLFAVTGCHESAYALWNSKKILDLSEQELVDCSRDGKDNKGCEGNTFVPTFNYIVKNGQSLEKDYRYTAKDMNDGWDLNNCTAEGLDHPSKFTDWWPVLPHEDENALKKAVAMYGPVAVAIYASPTMMQYKSGVLDEETCKGGRNHAVLVVGYGTEKGKDYWLVKNSWGTGWGDKGYIKMKRNDGNKCDIAGDAAFANAK